MDPNQIASLARNLWLQKDPTRDPQRTQVWLQRVAWKVSRKGELTPAQVLELAEASEHEAPPPKVSTMTPAQVLQQQHVASIVKQAGKLLRESYPQVDRGILNNRLTKNVWLLEKQQGTSTVADVVAITSVSDIPLRKPKVPKVNYNAPEFLGMGSPEPEL